MAGAVLGGLEGILYIACEYSDGNHRVPNVNRNSDGDWNFNLGNFENDWDSDNCLVCFCDSFDFSHYFVVRVFSWRLFFHPPSIRPTSSNWRMILPYKVWLSTLCSQAICRKNFKRSALPIACDTRESFSNLSYAKVALKMSSSSERKISSTFVPIVYRSTLVTLTKWSCQTL